MSTPYLVSTPYPEDDLTPQQLVARATGAGLALATGALATEEMGEHRAKAYERACGLAEVAIQAAAALLQQPEAQVQQQLVELSHELAERVSALEAGHEQ